MSATETMLIFFSALLAIGIVTGVIMGRRGHHPFTWGVLGTTFGPLVGPLALSSVRRERPALARRHMNGAATPQVGGALVGVDGSPEATAALGAVLDLRGPRPSRLTLAAVVDYDTAVSEDVWDERRAAEAELDRGAAPVEERLGRRPETVILTGRPAEALARHATQGGYQVLTIGGRGRGASKLILGSVATRLAR